MTQKAIIARLKEIEKLRKNQFHCTDPKYLELINEANKIKQAWYKKQESFREDLNTERKCLESDLIALKEKNELVVPDHIKRWLLEYNQGVDWGYGGLKIRWISEDEKWCIITNGGGTAGTGTPMGSGGYYYAETKHFLGRTDRKGGFTNRFGEVYGGKLTKEVKAKMIAMIPQFEIEK